MFNASAEFKIEVDFRESQAPSCHPSGVIYKDEGSLEGAMINAYRKMMFFKIRTEDEYGPYYCQTFALRCIVPLLSVAA